MEQSFLVYLLTTTSLGGLLITGINSNQLANESWDVYPDPIREDATLRHVIVCSPPPYRKKLLLRLIDEINAADPSLLEGHEHPLEVTLLLKISKSGKPISCSISDSVISSERSERIREILMSTTYEPLPEFFHETGLDFKIEITASEKLPRTKVLIPGSFSCSSANEDH
ncbi:MAG: hypothetical protein K2X77_02410 [Candidatus Obscuribacterales bacterium]|nr:hypothetical protein [Candidatus Obscuribacterales bacterium]